VLPDPKNMGIAVGILLLSRIQAEICIVYYLLSYFFRGGEYLGDNFLGVPFISRTPRATGSVLGCARRPWGLVSLFSLAPPSGPYFRPRGHEKGACVQKFRGSIGIRFNKSAEPFGSRTDGSAVL